MANETPLSNKKTIMLAYIAIGGFIAVNLGFAILRLTNRHFNPDEFQHLHIAWLIANGEIIYRDFWEHHGPLYALFNGAMIWLTSAEPTLRIAFGLRLLNLLIMSSIGILIWHLARQLSLSKIGAWLSVAVYASLFYVQNKGIEVRPDIPQTAFWIAGLLVLIRNQHNGSFRGAMLAGAMFALTILSNAKAGIGPFFAACFYLLAHWLCAISWQDIRRDVLGMLTGGLIAVAPILLYFSINNAALDFLYFNFIWNVEFILNFAAAQNEYTETGNTLAYDHIWFFIRHQLPFLTLAGLGILMWAPKLSPQQEPAIKKKGWLFIIVTFGTTAGWATNQHQQYFLIFLPLLAILVAYALTGIPRFFPAKKTALGNGVATVIALISAAAMLWHVSSNTPRHPTALMGSQKFLTQKVVHETTRDEPIAVYWNQCGGYMFNKHVGYYWVAMPAHSEIIEIISGQHPFSQDFINQMEQERINYVIGTEYWQTEGMSEMAMNYVRNNFRYDQCLWTRTSFLSEN